MTMNWDWLAGFIDGEGSFVLLRHKNPKSDVVRWYPRLIIVQANQPLLAHIIEFMGAGRMYEMGKNHLSSNPCYAIHVQGPALKGICEQLLPRLKVKGDQCRLLLESMEVAARDREDMSKHMKRLNHV